MSYELADGSLSTDYKEGDLFVGGFVGVNEETPQFVEGSIVRLERLDDTCCPCFKLVEGVFSDTVEPFGDNSIYEDWACLKKYTVKEQDPEVIIKQSDAFVRITQDEYDSLIDEINMLRELVAELMAVKEEQFKPIPEMTLEDWQQAMEDGWVFETRRGYLINVEKVFDSRNTYPVKGNNSLNYTVSGCFWENVKEHEADIIKRVK